MWRLLIKVRALSKKHIVLVKSIREWGLVGLFVYCCKYTKSFVDGIGISYNSAGIRDSEGFIYSITLTR